MQDAGSGRPPASSKLNAVGESARGPSRARLVSLGALLVTLVMLACAWRFTPLKDYVDITALTRISDRFAGSPLLPVVVLSAYFLGALLVIPLTLLIAATALIFGPLAGGIYALTCATLTSVVIYLVGRKLGQATLRRVAGQRVNAISERLARRGVMTVFLVRLLPIAPFTIVNLVAGASQIRLADFVVGTIAGLAPGTVLMVLFVDRLVDAVTHPGWLSALLILALAVLAVVGVLVVRCRLSRDMVGRC
jgi:phospholipase D1/2